MTPRHYVVNGVEVEAPSLPAGLFIVSTPIGNLGDITLRALATFAAADIIACEDTRVTGRLLRHYGISTRLVSYNDHNAPRRRPELLEALGAGQSVALASDAGTPLISDPGYRLVGEAVAGGHDVVPIPGASAVLAGLAAAGLPTDAFLFAGFLPPKPGERRSRLTDLAAVPATLVFYESAQRVAAVLANIAETLGKDRAVVMARELTKLHETIRRGSAEELAQTLAAEPTPKGEIVLLVGPPAAAEPSEAEIDERLRVALASASLSRAVADVVRQTGARRSEVYSRALAIRDEAGGGA